MQALSSIELFRRDLAERPVRRLHSLISHHLDRDHAWRLMDDGFICLFAGTVRRAFRSEEVDLEPAFQVELPHPRNGASLSSFLYLFMCVHCSCPSRPSTQISQMFSKLKIYEDDPTINVVILKVIAGCIGVCPFFLLSCLRVFKQITVVGLHNFV